PALFPPFPSLPGMPHPPPPSTSVDVSETLAGFMRTLGTAPLNRKAAATVDIVSAMLATLPRDTLIGQRDRAIIALGFAAALRRSELVALDVPDLTEVA